MTENPKKIGWWFPPTNGGIEGGFHDAGIETFTGNRLRSLARETVQNSMDARSSSTHPVKVSFEIRKMPRRKEFCFGQLASHVDACIEETTDKRARQLLEHARRVLKKTNIPFLLVSDSNTTGLVGKQWNALVKMTGTSEKQDSAAGGSFGIGKSAPFAVSPLRTVYYWTCFDEGSRLVERFQAKAILLSHDFDVDGASQRTQGTGFFGYMDECRALTGDSILPQFRICDQLNVPVRGTAVWIAGFPPGEFSREEVAQSIIESFFYALENSDLEILLEFTQDGDLDSGFSEIEISSKTLDSWFGHLLHGIDVEGECTDEDRTSIWEARIFRDLMRISPTESRDFASLGKCDLWLSVRPNLPRKVALIRGTGMLITSQQKGLIQFRGLRDFAAVCKFRSEKGNELLRLMENPQHNQFEPDRLPAADRKEGKAALNEVVRWIRDTVKKHAGVSEEEFSKDLIELSDMLPDLESSGPLSDEEVRTDREKAFGTSGQIRFKPPPRRQIHKAKLPREISSADEQGDGEATGQHGGSIDQRTRLQKKKRNSDGNGSDGLGSRGGNVGIESVHVHDVRVLKSVDLPGRYRVSFTPSESAVVSLELAEAGDSSFSPLAGVQAFGIDGSPLSLDRIELSTGDRFSLEVETKESMADVAWCLIAKKGLSS